MLRKVEGKRRRGLREDEMVRNTDAKEACMLQSIRLHRVGHDLATEQQYYMCVCREIER